METAVKALHELGDVAAEVGVRISIYNHVGNWTESLPFVIEVIRKTNHPQVGYNFNLCHWLKVNGGQDYRPLLHKNADKLFVRDYERGDHRRHDLGRAYPAAG